MSRTYEPVFIVGSGRCGTTLLARLLHHHPDIAAGFELNAFRVVLDALRRQGDIDQEAFATASRDLFQPDSGHFWGFSFTAFAERANDLLQGWHVPSVQRTSLVKLWVDDLHHGHMLIHGATRIVHKTPALACYLRDLWGLWPHSKVIHVMRHPLSAIGSYLSNGFGPGTAEQAIDWYCDRVWSAAKVGRGYQNYREVLLEELVVDPVATLSELLDWMGLNPDVDSGMIQEAIRPPIKYLDDSIFLPLDAQSVFDEVVRRVPFLAEIYDERDIRPRDGQRIQLRNVGSMDSSDIPAMIADTQGVAAVVDHRWGWGRGRPVDRYYIEKFLESHAACIYGTVCEVKSDAYTRRFGGVRVGHVDVVDIDGSNPRATLHGDLQEEGTLAQDRYDCIILTQVLQYVQQPGAAITNCYKALRRGGVLLVSIPCVSRISDEPEDLWRFTSKGISRLLQMAGVGGQVEIQAFGNTVACNAFLYGFSEQDVGREALEYLDIDCPLVIMCRVMKE
jgi:SAM-dependent methyltransferase